MGLQMNWPDFKEFSIPRKRSNPAIPKAYGKVVPENHILLEKHGNKAEITLVSRDGVAGGKALLQLFDRKETLANLNELVINVSSSVSIGSIVNYSVCPPGHMDKAFNGQKITVRLHNFKAALQLPALITTTGNGKNADETCSILPELFRKDVQYEIVETTKMNRANLLKQLRRTSKELDQRNDLTPQLKTNIEKTLQKIEEYITSEKLVFINKKETFEQKTVPGRRAYANPVYVNELLAGKTFYVQTDETTHLKLIEKTLYIVDTGNPSTVAYVKALLKKDPDCIKNIVIMQTHFHDDHCARLPELLSFIRKNKIPTTLAFNQSLYHQFTGFLTTHLRVFKNSPTLNILPTSNNQPHKTTKKSKTNFQLFDYVPDLIRHFIQSNGYFLQDGSQGIFFTGDINPLPPKKNHEEQKELIAQTKESLQNYLQEILKTAIEKNIKQLAIYADAGHFEGTPELLAAFENIVKELQKFYKINISLYKEHFKDPKYYKTIIL